MRIAPAQSPGAPEAGFILIEVLVSAVVLVIASAGVVALLQTTVHSQAEERHASEAYSLAQEDQARLSAMRVETLFELNENRTITLNQTQFDVHSVGSAINDLTSAPSCGEGTYKVDYVQITSIVTWPGMANAEKAKIVSKISPSKGSLSPGVGSLAVSVTNQSQTPMPGVSLYGGSGAINGFTDSTGCGIFPNLTAGNYKLRASGEAAGLVNKMGKDFEEKEVSVIGGDTKRLAFEFDRPGSIPVEFRYRVGSEERFLPATADTVVVSNPSLEYARIFGTPGGPRANPLTADKLFPFSSAYTVYAGSCESNNPDPQGEGINEAAYANVVVPANGSAPVTLQLPAVELAVKNGANPVEGATVTLTDTRCKNSQGKLVKRTYTTDEEGLPIGGEVEGEEAAGGGTEQPALGLPWGEYTVCASAKISGVNRRKRGMTVTAESLTSAAQLSIDLGSGYESERTC